MTHREAEPHEHHEFSGSWWRFPIMRDALLAGAMITVTWVLGHVFGLPKLEPFGYAVAMILGGNHFVREGLEELRKPRSDPHRHL